MSELPTYLQIADTLRTQILAIASGKVSEYDIGGRRFTFHNLKELSALEQEFRKLANEEIYGVVTVADISLQSQFPTISRNSY